ncbi:MAG: hypothetical protein BroJett018_52700 [Chloroflexota bacterium]|nr:MAG: hypothetical protein BroJett018_52700 [Chloroflexota bacterium]
MSTHEPVSIKVPFLRRVVVQILYLPVRLIKLVLFLIIDVYALAAPLKPRLQKPQPAYKPESQEERINRLTR